MRLTAVIHGTVHGIAHRTVPTHLANPIRGGMEWNGREEELGTAAYHLKVGGSDGLWITRRPADPQPPMQTAIYGGAW